MDDPSIVEPLAVMVIALAVLACAIRGARGAMKLARLVRLGPVAVLLPL